ncbi:MAG: prolyl oligopeptidase family serine peptidase [Pseudomonadota bacterium]
MSRPLSLISLALLAACQGEDAAVVAPALDDAVAKAAEPYGSWSSPITAASLVESARGLWGLRRDGAYLYWLESRPAEGGRATIMRWRDGEAPEELLAAPWNVRTRVQEYGGAELLVADGTLWFSNYADQRLYRFQPGEEPQPITPAAELRYAGCVLDTPRERLICIREDHRGLGEPSNELVAIPAQEAGLHEGEPLFSGTDFVSAPSLSPDGERIAFTSWMHPNMPWDSTQLHSARFAEDGSLASLTLHNPDADESVVDPQWDSAGELIALSDRDNWWRPYRVEGERFVAMDTGLTGLEIGGPDWTIGSRYLYPQADGSLLAVARRGSVEMLYSLDGEGRHRLIDTGAVSYGSLVPDADGFLMIAGFADRPSALVRADASGKVTQRIRSSRDSALAADWIPAFEQLSFPLAGGGEAHGVYYPPTNPQAQAPADSAPPLIVSAHGGPTSVAGVTYNPAHYYWTSRGFAVLDLNYRGSTGFGREYRRALYGQWGIADVEDAVAAAGWLAEQGLADRERLIIRGGSAGGYTTLAAHAFHNVFSAGASYYGISDIEALAEETHKFESRYLDQLIGPYPERRDLYVERSPIHHLEGFAAPLILLQGLEDPVVPPNQSERIYSALRDRGVATAYVAYEGESHGFRKAENQIHAREAELYFYSQVLDFPVADELGAVAIDNLE